MARERNARDIRKLLEAASASKQSLLEDLLRIKVSSDTVSVVHAFQESAPRLSQPPVTTLLL